ncbi:MAG: hypothetical protein NXH82_08520 [Rhodobacteraceae bacterium]|nr:hypothetical protein [Paracoccaceae bacterium]
MFTWISRTGVLLFAPLALAGCEGGAGLAFAPPQTETPAPARAGMTQAPLAGGAVQLRAPDGYCIDPQSLDAPGFALLARCDTLGAAAPRGRDLALISVSVAPLPNAGDAAPSAEALTASAGATATLDRRARGAPLTLVRLSRETPVIAGLSASFWRGAFVVNGHVVGLSLYAPPDSRALGNRGAALLSATADRTLEASLRPDAGPDTETDPEKTRTDPAPPATEDMSAESPLGRLARLLKRNNQVTLSTEQKQ